MSSNPRDRVRQVRDRLPNQTERSGVSVSMPIETFQRTAVNDPNASAAGGVGLFALGMIAGVVIGVVLYGEVDDSSTEEPRTRDSVVRVTEAPRTP